MRLTRELPCPTCGGTSVKTLSHDETDGNGGQAVCPDCGARWRVHDGVAVPCWQDPPLGTRAVARLLRMDDVHDPWPDVDRELDDEDDG
jgi:uncharacterized protein YbaR (Trm112 family)